MTEMEIYTKTKIIKRGKSSYAVPIPKILMDELGVKFGDLVEVKKNGNTVVLVFPVEGKAAVPQVKAAEVAPEGPEPPEKDVF